MTTIQYTPIGIVRSPFTERERGPRQPRWAMGVAGAVELDRAYREALADLEGFSHILLIVHLHQADGVRLTVTPPLDDRPRGLFATRAPCRPNPIGVSVVRLVRVEGTTLRVLGGDLLDGTPVLDIKPYVPGFDMEAGERVRIGWLTGKFDQQGATEAGSLTGNPHE